MKLKYYMRGLGIGILVTVLLMSTALKGKDREPMTDEQIKERAAALGMAEQGGTLLKDLPAAENNVPEDGEAAEQDAASPKPEDAAAEAAKTAGSGSAGAKSGGTSAKTAGSGSAGAKSGGTSAKTAGNSAKPENTATEEVPFTVASGAGSYGTSKALEDLGLVESASEFDRYLCQKGYDSKICAGNFEIPRGATYEEIAGIITKR